jgi:hypothetical protein
MHNFNKCCVAIDFEFCGIDNRFMRLEIEYNNQRLVATPVLDNQDHGTAVVELLIELPTTIQIKTSGKTQSDTIIDADGNHLKDMCIKVKSVKLDRFELKDSFLYNKILLNTDCGQHIKSNYLGFNGNVVIDFKCNNVFSQYHECNR